MHNPREGAMLINFEPLSEKAQNELSEYAIVPGFRVVSAASIPSALPQRFREKIDSAVLIAEPTSTGALYLVFNNYRVDEKARAVDQEPFAVVMHTTGIGSVGMYVHHGDWPGRTFSPPPELWTNIDRYGIGNYFLSYPIGGKTSGALEELSPGDRNAFSAVIKHVRRGPVLLI